MNPAEAVTHDMTDKVCVVTGANTGIGFVTARELARAGARVFLACRSEERGGPALAQITRDTPRGAVELLLLDLASLDSVRACARAFLERELPLHVLVCNAGLGGVRGATRDGFELAFGVNHLGHFLLTCMLLPKLKASAPARIVVVSSKSHYAAKRIDFEAVRHPSRGIFGLPEYEVSKLANVLLTKELAIRLAGSGVTTYAVHPGTVGSDVWRHTPWAFRALMKRLSLSNEQGAKTTLYCATAPALAGETGLYYDKCRPKRSSRVSQNPELAAELWRRSAEWTGCG